MEIMAEMKRTFAEKFGQAEAESASGFFSPGRVNLIGEHTDYNGGHVFPCAISLGTYALVHRRSDGRARLFSMNLAGQGIVEVDRLQDLHFEKRLGWANYPLGVVRMLEEAGHPVRQGFDLVFYGTLPPGAGLSSSASLEVLMGVILDDLSGWGMDRIALVKLAQKAENRFVGVNCGIMDQFAVGMGKKDCAILLDCSTLDYRYSKIRLEGCSIVITNTNKAHSLNGSKYNERRSQCESALAQLQKKKPIRSLGELTTEEFDALAGAIQDPVERKRARHAVCENQRTLQAVAALEKNDTALFGRLMNDSHASLRDDYEVTGKELDTLAALAWEQSGVIGSRMTGGGFGGCTVSLVKNEAIPAFRENIARGCTKAVGYAPSFYVASIADGAKKLF